MFLTPKHVAKTEKFITAESNPILGFAFPRKIECDMCPFTKTALNIKDTTLTWPSCLDIDFFNDIPRFRSAKRKFPGLMPF